MKAKVSGSSAQELEVCDRFLDAAFNEGLVHQIVVAYQAGKRAGTVGQKSRGEVRGGGRKPWRQKGTGRARAGTIRSPLWRSGGKIFPAETQNFEQKVNRKMYRGAMRSIFSELYRQERLLICDSFSVAEPKTKILLAKLESLGLSNVLIVTELMDEALYLAARNLPSVQVRECAKVDPVTLIKHESVVITVAALQQLEEVFSHE
jgi:large subunit ribosomal protein L4